MPAEYRIKVPGKVIISGEHAVVMGAPALAAACTLYVENHIRENNGKNISIKSKENENTDPLYYAVRKFEERFGLTKGADMEISSSVPTGSGMGSSAAAITSVFAGLCILHDIRLPKKELVSIIRDCENLVHGTSSGLDPAAVVSGGIVKLEKGKILPGPAVALGKGPGFSIIFTGRPLSTTGEAVSHTKKLFTPELLQKFTEAEKNIETALQENDEALLLKSITENERLLEKIGVVPAPVTAFAEKVEALGGAFKISGAGAIRGTGAGIGLVFGMGDRGLQLKELCDRAGYTIFNVRIHDGGVECLL